MLQEHLFCNKLILKYKVETYGVVQISLRHKINKMKQSLFDCQKTFKYH